MTTPDNQLTPTMNQMAKAGCGWRIMKAAIWLLVLSPFFLVGFFFLYLWTSGGSGSADEADQLRRMIEKVSSPDDERLPISGYAAKRFDSGEWIVGIGTNSHGFLSKLRGGGTIVVKDSRDNIRCFLGHVCGSDDLRMRMKTASSLDDFYKEQTKGFQYGELILRKTDGSMPSVQPKVNE